MLCLYDLLDDGDEDHDECCEWIDALDKGWLLMLRTKATYHVFVCMEYIELWKHLVSVQVQNLKDVAKSIKTIRNATETEWPPHYKRGSVYN